MVSASAIATMGGDVVCCWCCGVCGVGKQTNTQTQKEDRYSHTDNMSGVRLQGESTVYARLVEKLPPRLVSPSIRPNIILNSPPIPTNWRECD